MLQAMRRPDGEMRGARVWDCMRRTEMIHTQAGYLDRREQCMQHYPKQSRKAGHHHNFVQN